MHEAINAVNHLDCSRYCQKSLQHSHNNHNHTIRCPGNESFWGVQALQGLQSLGQSISRDTTLTLSLSTSAATLQTDCPSRVEEPHWICLCILSSFLGSYRKCYPENRILMLPCLKVTVLRSRARAHPISNPTFLCFLYIAVGFGGT